MEFLSSSRTSGTPKNSTPIGENPQGLLSTTTKALANSYGISLEMNVLLNKYIEVKGKIKIAKGRANLANEIGALVKKMFDTVEREKGNKAT